MLADLILPKYTELGFGIKIEYENSGHNAADDKQERDNDANEKFSFLKDVVKII